MGAANEPLHALSLVQAENLIINEKKSSRAGSVTLWFGCPSPCTNQTRQEDLRPV
jgi:hypothetical protein